MILASHGGRVKEKHISPEERLINVHGPALELAFSYLVPCLPGLREKYLPQFRKKEASGEVPVIKGVVSLFARNGHSPAAKTTTAADGKTLFTISISSDFAKEAKLLEAPIHDFAETDSVDGVTLFHVEGAIGLSRFQGAILQHLRSLPLERKFQIPFGLDTEVFVRPERFGFKKPGT
jgi:hypothetical protein